MARWNERLHPRDLRGRFAGRGGGSAARAARREGNRAAPGQRGRRARGYAGAAYAGTGSIAASVVTGYVGRRSRSRSLVAGSAANAGIGVAAATHRARTTRRQTSRAFAALNPEQQAEEIARSRKIDRRYAIAGGLSGAGVGFGAQRQLERGALNAQRDHEWRVKKARHADRKVPGQYTRFQGPGGHRAKRANRRGIYDVTSSPVRKPKSQRARRAAGYASEFKRRTGRSARARTAWARRNRKSRGTAVARRGGSSARKMRALGR